MIFMAKPLVSPEVSGAEAEERFVFDKATACHGFSKTFPHELDKSWASIPDESVHADKPLLDSQTNLVFGGTGPGGRGQFGVGNATHYTVNVFKAEKPDLLADMNSIEELTFLPDNRFDVIIAANIPIECFAPGCFINARRLLVQGGVFIVNTLDVNPDNTYRSDYAAIDSCLALFGFEPVRHKLDDFEGQLRGIGFTEDQFPFGESVDIVPCLIYQKI